MKITIVCGFFLPVPPVAGGAVEKMWWRLARLYAARGHTVTMISRRWPGWADQETKDGVQMVRLGGYSHRKKLLWNLLLDALWGLKVFFALPAADILVTNTIALPVFVRRFKARAGLLVVNVNRFPKKQLRWYHDVARVQAASGIIAAAARQQAPALAPVIRLTPNSIDTSAFTGPRATRDASRPVRIGFLGRIHPEKGLLTLVQAAALLAEDRTLPPWQLMLRGPLDVPRGGGGDAFAGQLRAAAPALWEDARVQLLPPLFDARELADAYRDLDIFCYPTEAAEGEAHPVAVLEAMATGLAVVASDLSCFADQLRNGTNASLVPPGDPAALAAALRRLIREPATRIAFGTEARATIWALDDAAIATQHLDDYAALLDASRT